MPTPDDSRAARDLTDRIIDDWSGAYPRLDVGPIGVLGRIQRIASISGTSLERSLAPHGVSRSEFDVLCALARSARPMRAGDVTSITLLSAASVTKITESLNRRGLVARTRSERDGRVVLLEPTDVGRELVDTVIPARLAADEQALAGLTETERQTLATLLRRVAVGLEGVDHSR